MEKTSVNDTGCNWFALLEPHIVFNALLKQFMVLLKGTLFMLKICITIKTDSSWGKIKTQVELRKKPGVERERV